jgi:hypothetical protein
MARIVDALGRYRDGRLSCVEAAEVLAGRQRARIRRATPQKRISSLRLSPREMNLRALRTRPEASGRQ